MIKVSGVFMKLSIYLSIYLFSINLFASKQDEPKSNLALISTVQYFNSFNTADEVFEDLYSGSFITLDEKKSIESFLDSRGILYKKEKLLKGKLNNSNVKMGNNIELNFSDRENIKLSNGKYIKLKGKKADQVFIEIFESLNNKNVKYSLFVQNAYASVELFEAISSASYITSYHAIKTLMTPFLAVVGSIGTNIIGFPLEFILISLRNIIYKGKVFCKNDQYVVNIGFEGIDWLKEFEFWKKSAKTGTEDLSGREFSNALYGYSSNVSGAVMAGGLLISNAFSPKANELHISDEELKLIFKTDSPPKCSDENAKKAYYSLKYKAKGVYNQIRKYINPAVSEPAKILNPK